MAARPCPSPATLNPADEPWGDSLGEEATEAEARPAVPRARNEPEPRAAASESSNEPERRPAARPAAANENAPNEPERPAALDLTPAERLEIEAMIASGEPALILEAAARAGALDQVAPLFGAAATARGRSPPRTA